MISILKNDVLPFLKTSKVRVPLYSLNWGKKDIKKSTPPGILIYSPTRCGRTVKYTGRLHPIFQTYTAYFIYACRFNFKVNTGSLLIYFFFLILFSHEFQKGIRFQKKKKKGVLLWFSGVD